MPVIPGMVPAPIELLIPPENPAPPAPLKLLDSEIVAGRGYNNLIFILNMGGKGGLCDDSRIRKRKGEGKKLNRRKD